MAAILSAGLMLAGCTQDVLVPEPEAPLDKDTDFYLNVQISVPSEESTRAGDGSGETASYVNGTAAEQTIHEILFVFYNSEYQYVGKANYYPKKTDSGYDYEGNLKPNGNAGSKDPSGSIESLLKITVDVKVAAGSTKPAYVMAYVNPTLNASGDLYNDHFTAIGAMRTLKDVIPSTTEDGKEHKGYTMNNSVYYQGTGHENDLPVIAVPVGDSLFTDPNDAGTKDPVVIFVERVVAKVTLNVNDTETEPFSQTGNQAEEKDGTTTKYYALKFKIKAWGLNNLEKYTFLVKNFRTGSKNFTGGEDDLFEFDNCTYSVADGRFVNTSGETTYSNNLSSPYWNSPKVSEENVTAGVYGARSFWAISPTYHNNDQLKIPSYTDEFYDPDKTTAEQKKTSLYYRSFNDFFNTNKNEKGAFGNETGATAYTLEHTMLAGMVADYQKRAVTCAVVVGQYELYASNSLEDLSITDETQKEELEDNFYIRQALNTSDGSKETVIYPSDAKMKKAFLEKNTTIYIKDDAGKYVQVPAALDGEGNNEYFEDFEIYHPRDGISGNCIPSRYVTLKLKPKTTDVTTEGGTSTKYKHDYYYQKPSGDYETITYSADKDFTEINKTLYENLTGQLGGVEQYMKGYAYFEVPIRHLWGRDKSGIGENDFSPSLGQYGIVRNHCYNLKVKGIEGIGTGISDPNAPIIPNVETDTYMVKTDIKVQRWRIVPVQEVTLKP